MRREILATVKLSIPIIIAQLGVILMGVTDNLMVGRFLGAVPLGASGLATSLTFLVSSIGFGGLGIVSSLISQAKGQNNTQEIGNLFRAGMNVGIMLGILLGIVGIGLGLSLDFFGQTPEVTRLAKPFIYILSISILPLLVFVAARQLADGLSYTKVAMFVTVSALFFNALINWVLIKGVWIFPKMGLNGAALGTLFSRLYMAIVILGYIFRSKYFKIYLHFPNQNITPLIKRIFKLTIPVGFQFFFEVAAFSLAVVLIGWLGESQLAAHQIAINLASTTYMMATGIAAAGAIRVGQAWGQNNLSKVKQAGTAAFVIVAAFMGVCCITFLTANDFLVSLYLKDNLAVTSIASTLMIYAGFFQLSDGIQATGLGTLRGLTDVNVPTGITLVAYWVIALPLSYLLAFTFKMDVEGVWIALSAGLTFSALFLTIRFYWLIDKMSTNIKKTAIMH
ncbi:MATE family efflux transporter [Runella sp. MFBS21]|uniref:MATE family efflux transporter n=1 Tax=Runella sp. MFBS21 TaxID=3034018 RepID=UPI0023F768C1|nr:MATE family efflux transporter [Runella sp. MFBS21]MDF7819567.1 MATE family efflux transporter [Runella sp. MFBS21]